MDSNSNSFLTSQLAGLPHHILDSPSIHNHMRQFLKISLSLSPWGTSRSPPKGKPMAPRCREEEIALVTGAVTILTSWTDCCCLVTKPSPTLCDPTDCSLPGFSVHEISQARILEWVAFSFYLPDPMIKPNISLSLSCISCIGRWVLYC